MRLSSFSFTAVLIFSSIAFSSIAFAQHTASAPAPAPSASHSAPSAPAHTSAPATAHIASSSTPSHISTTPSKAATAPARQLENRPVSADTITPERKISGDDKLSGEERIASAPRIGENPPDKIEKEVEENHNDGKQNEDKLNEEKPATELRRWQCIGDNCQRSSIEPQKTELRRPNCLDGRCTCPSGETENKGACTPVAHPAPCVSGAPCPNTDAACPTGQVRNGATCAPAANRCMAGQVWNGSSCLANCSILTTQAQGLIGQLRGAHQKRDEACIQDSGGMSCAEFSGQYQSALAEYENLLGRAAPECRPQLADPSSI
jgi:hypothetical protein